MLVIMLETMHGDVIVDISMNGNITNRYTICISYLLDEYTGYKEFKMINTRGIPANICYALKIHLAFVPTYKY